MKAAKVLILCKIDLRMLYGDKGIKLGFSIKSPRLLRNFELSKQQCDNSIDSLFARQVWRKLYSDKGTSDIYLRANNSLSGHLNERIYTTPNPLRERS